MSSPRDSGTEADTETERLEAPEGGLERRIERIAALIDVGVDIRAALATEMIRSLRAGHLDREAMDRLFTRAERADSDAVELHEARVAARAGRIDAAIAELQEYLQRIMVDEVPISERRLRRQRQRGD